MDMILCQEPAADNMMLMSFFLGGVKRERWVFLAIQI